MELVPLGLLRMLAPRPHVSLLYHLCSDGPLAHVDPLYSYKTPAEFEQDLVYLRRHFPLVAHEQVRGHYEGGSPLPANAVELSFDDGLAECFSLVRPLLLQYGIPSTFFIITNLVDNASLMFRHRIALCLDRLGRLSEADASSTLRELSAAHGVTLSTLAEACRWIRGLGFDEVHEIDRVCESLGLDIQAYLRERRPYLTSEEILELHKDGFTIGAHSCNHPRLEGFRSWKAARREIVESCAAIRRLTGQSRVPFAIPFNGLALDRAALQELLDDRDAASLIYDTNDLMRDESGIVNRVCVDSRVGAHAERSNLGHLIRRAYALEPYRALRRRTRGLRGRLVGER